MFSVVVEFFGLLIIYMYCINCFIEVVGVMKLILICLKLVVGIILLLVEVFINVGCEFRVKLVKFYIIFVVCCIKIKFYV